MGGQSHDLDQHPRALWQVPPLWRAALPRADALLRDISAQLRHSHEGVAGEIMTNTEETLATALAEGFNEKLDPDARQVKFTAEDFEDEAKMLAPVVERLIIAARLGEHIGMNLGCVCSDSLDS